LDDTYHYTDEEGFKGIAAQPDWRFEARLPRGGDRPCGAYFTTLAPTAANLRSLCAKLRIPRTKRDCVFEFVGRDGLKALNDGRGRDRYILYSRDDYLVSRESGRQRFKGRSEELRDRIP
jgi:hypothetical protein